MKKIYFISPDPLNYSVYYIEVSDYFDVSSMNRLNIGYNDSYEMRSEYLDHPYFSENYDDIRQQLVKRRVDHINTILSNAYKQTTKLAEMDFEEEGATKHDRIISPF